MVNYLLPHFFPAGRFLILHLFGMVMAVAGLILACLARGDKRTAQRHLGAVLSKAPTLAQQANGTFAFTLLTAPKHGLRLAAADPIGVFPHSPPAPSASKINTSDANRNISNATRKSTLPFMSLIIILSKSADTDHSLHFYIWSVQLICFSILNSMD